MEGAKDRRGRVLIVGGRPLVLDSLEEAVRRARGRDVYIVYCEGGRLVFLRVEDVLDAGAPAEPGAGEAAGPGRGEGVAVVFDQMYKGFAQIIARELPGVRAYEVLGRGISGPVEREGVVLLPAEDDYDVLKHVLDLSGRHRLVVLVTGDKRLARQAEAAGGEGVRVIYLPPGEAPGKELLARRLVEEIRALAGGKAGPG